VSDFPKPSTYTPFFRRFTNETRREQEETLALYAWVRARQDAFTENETTIGKLVVPTIEDAGELFRPLTFALYDLLIDEPCFAQLHPPDFERMNMRELVEYRNLLYAKQYFFQNEHAVLATLVDGLRIILGGLADRLPKTETPSPFTIPLVYALPNAPELIDLLYNTLVLPEYLDRGIFKSTTERLYANLCRASGRDPHGDSKKPIKRAGDSDLPLREMVDTYLADTTFHDLFSTLVPLKFTHEDRFSHMHILGGTNAGKSTLIERLIVHDIQSDSPPSIVLIDPHSDLVRKLARTDLGIEDRLIIIDPRDTKHFPALNIFAINKERFSAYDEATQEQVTAGVIQTFGYLFGGLTNLALTGKQEVFFRYIARLMLSLPESMGRNATILDMMKLMSDPVPYGAAIAALPDIPRDFFLKDFMSKTFEQTKEQIRYRLQAIIENPTMARLFTSAENKVDLFTELNRGAVILVDTAKDFLKENSSTFGRLFISLVLQAVLERAAIPEARRKPTFIFVDEAGSFFSSNIDDLLTEARKYKAGLILAHQYLDQCTGSLKASLAANTSIKMASGLSAADAAHMAREMRTTPDFILNQPRFHIAAHIRNVTPQAVSIPIEPVKGLPQLSETEYRALLERNRARVSLTRLSAAQPEAVVLRPEDPDQDISPEW